MAWLWAHVGASQQDSRRRRRRCRRDCTPATADGNVVRAGTWASRLRPSRETCSSLVPALGPCIITRAHCRARKTAHAEVMERGTHSAHSRMRTLVQQACVRDPPPGTIVDVCFLFDMVLQFFTPFQARAPALPDMPALICEWCRVGEAHRWLRLAGGPRLRIFLLLF